MVSRYLYLWFTIKSLVMYALLCLDLAFLCTAEWENLGFLKQMLKKDKIVVLVTFIVQLLAMVPGSSPLGCLAPVSGALFHPLPKVRTLAAKLLAVLDQFKAAKPCVSGLNTFLLLGYDCAREGRVVMTRL